MTPSGSTLPPPDYPAILSAAAHDLRSPLATVYGFARTIERVAPLPDPQAGFLQHVLDASRDLDRLLGHLSTLARIGDGRFAPATAPVSTATLAAGVAAAGAAEAGTDDEPWTVLAADAEAIEALALLADAAARLDPSRPGLVVRAAGDGVELGTVGESVEPLLTATEGARDLVLVTALQTLRALGASLTATAGVVRVTFPTA